MSCMHTHSVLMFLFSFLLLGLGDQQKARMYGCTEYLSPGGAIMALLRRGRQRVVGTVPQGVGGGVRLAAAVAASAAV